MPNNKPIIAYKGFDADMTCRGFQYEIGKTYEHNGDISLCESGFHACRCPLDVFGYYPPTDSVYALVEMSGEHDHGNDKTVSSKITIKAGVSIAELVNAHVEYVREQVRDVDANTGDQSAATNTGYRSAATNTGDLSAATNTGDRSAATNTGYRSAATNTGDQSAATNTGYRSAATNTGYQSAATNTGYLSAATNTGYQSAATNTGYQSAATNTGYQSAATVEGADSIAVAIGYQGKAKACKGSWVVLAERNDEGEILCVRTGKAGEDIKPDVFYMLIDGEFARAEAE